MDVPAARSTGPLASINNNRTRSILVALALVFCAVWLSQTWSQSSYGQVLRALQASDDGVVLGSPRGIISDEWGVITPWIQSTVNNSLQRYNKTSFYGEDLRTLISMPLLDWGLPFKPDKWLYPFVNAAYAFSFQALFFLCAFLVGYGLLFRRLGASDLESGLLAVTLICTGFVQFWWGVFAPTVSLFPWILLALDLRRPLLQGAAIVWLGACWMLGFFYPPMFIPLAMAGAALFVALHFRHDRLSVTVVPAVASVLACVVVVFYLHDYLVGTLSTVFPGQRRIDGGGVPAEMFADMVFPGGHLLKFETTATTFNVAESSVVGTAYLLFVIAFLDYRRMFTTTIEPTTRRLLIAMAVAFAVLTAWQTLPIPGRWALWTGLPWVLARRSMFASGLLLLLMAFVLARAYGFTFSSRRYVALCALVLFGWGVTKANLQASLLWRAWPDLLIIPIAAVTLVPHRMIQQHRNVAVAGCCAVFGVLAFGWFNPIQKAWPIFNRESTPLTELLDYEQSITPGNILVSDQFGAVLNGWGYRSVAHVLSLPPLARWRELFPGMDAEKFNFVFNRFAHVKPVDEAEPRLMENNVIGVPRTRFEPREQIAIEAAPGTVRAERANGAIAYDNRNGHIDVRRLNGRNVVLYGWAPWKGIRADQRLTVVSDSEVEIVRFRRAVRGDVVSVHHNRDLAVSGFEVEVEIPAGQANARLCVVTQENASAPRTLIVEDAGECARSGAAQ